jgi:hypothetical protein
MPELSTITKPEIVSVSDLLDSVMNGEFRVPRFQRPYVWSPDDMIRLYDSVLKGYPIGSLLLWQTDQSDIRGLDSIGPIKLLNSGPSLKSFVVDGHQRLATLLGVLRLPENYPREKPEDWRWWIAYDLRTEALVHVKSSEPTIPLHLLPLRNVLRTVEFARRTRQIASSALFAEEEVVIFLDRADQVQRAIRDYRVPLTTMRYGTLDDAVNIFARVNQRGRDMTADQMVSALTYRENRQGAFDLSDIIDSVLGDLRANGFGDLERRIILQVILALAGLDFTRLTYENIVNRESAREIKPAVERANSALDAVTRFFRDRVGLRTSRLLPYASIIVMLAIFFDEATNHDKSIADAEEVLQRWFWATSFNGWFAGANTTDLRRGGDLMRRLARGESGSTNEFKEMFFDPPIRQFPETFDRRSARVRASLLVQIIAGKPLEPMDGQPIDGSAVFADEASRDIPYFFPKHRRPLVSSPANRVILPGHYKQNARADFTRLRGRFDESAILNSHFISDEAFQLLVEERVEEFIRAREIAISAAERGFLSQFQLVLDTSAPRSTEEIDTDE